nr:hypothetical protein [Tanacetum cinerariifolium]
MSKQCTKPKRKRDDTWFKDKVLLVQAQANGHILHEEELAFLSDLGIAEGQAIQTVITNNVLAEVHNPDHMDNNMLNQDTSPSCTPTRVEVPKELPKKKGLIIAALKDELRKLKRKALVDNAVTTHTIDPEMLKIDVEPLAPRLLNNRTSHSDYLRLTQEQAVILKEVVEQGNFQNPLNNSLDFA